ncbi:TauD/TfdA family dioxygenase [Burkholderia gladioli]|uniref:TauD/TfdA family dioxygenase n=1 Tax=Burkholderia gladioli TaxID=28095 RepID=UPI000649B407|nr:TauD/TfdA family dioxygenase [Burkholderia gladioli]MDA0573817.1 TauD/TfdA family dioxygenase [Burkholderia gladioli]MDA0602156.1 TauD/TfdA family dioxygenase [Burkholderia gladioli]
MTPTETHLIEGARLPLVIDATHAAASERNAAAFVAAHRDYLLKRLGETGALLLRGFQVQGAAEFGACVAALDLPPMRYLYRSTPRTATGDALYTATEYPADREIPLHNENSYQRTWPKLLAFCCVQPAASGGSTPLADMRVVHRRLGAPLMDRFEALGVRYDRVFHDGIDLSWQEVFQTGDRGDVERFCDDNAIACEWLDADTLRTSQTCQGVVRHPLLGERCFFNQAHLYHPSSLGSEMVEAIVDAFGEDRLPRNACFGNGEAIDADTLATIRAAFDQAAIDFTWQQGDIALLDNLQVAHGRRSYRGARRVLASLLDPNHP